MRPGVGRRHGVWVAPRGVARGRGRAGVVDGVAGERARGRVRGRREFGGFGERGGFAGCGAEGGGGRAEKERTAEETRDCGHCSWGGGGCLEMGVVDGGEVRDGGVGCAKMEVEEPRGATLAL